METCIRHVLQRFGVVPVFAFLVVAFFACAWLFSWVSAEWEALFTAAEPAAVLRDSGDSQ